MPRQSKNRNEAGKYAAPFVNSLDLDTDVKVYNESISEQKGKRYVMDITPQEENMIKAFREAALPPLFVLIRIRNDILNDTVNVEASRRADVVKTLENYIGPL